MIRKNPPHHQPVEHFYRRHPWLERKNETIHELRKDFMFQKMNFMREIQDNNLSIQELEQELDLLLEKQILMERHIGKFMIEMRQNLTDEQVELFFNKPQDKQHRVFREEIKKPKNRRKK